jgi:multiple antibiotic resistance protein
MKLNRKAIRALPIILIFVSCAAVAQIPEIAASVAAPHTSQDVLASIALGKIFTYFMVMLGPIKLLGPFVKISNGMDASASRILALKGFGIACVSGVIAAVLGKNTLTSWGISLPALLLATGLVLLLVALKAVLSQYEQPSAGKRDTSQPAPKFLALSPLAFPNIITPYGVAALILIDAATPPDKSPAIFGVFLAIMVINLIAMFFARPILKYGADILTILGAVLGVLQVALAIQMLLLACRMLGIVPAG